MKEKLEIFWDLMAAIGGAGIGAIIMAFGWTITKNSLTEYLFKD